MLYRGLTGWIPTAPLLHFGMALIRTPYGQNPQIIMTHLIGSSPYGPDAIVGQVIAKNSKGTIIDA